MTILVATIANTKNTHRSRKYIDELRRSVREIDAIIISFDTTLSRRGSEFSDDPINGILDASKYLRIGHVMIVPASSGDCINPNLRVSETPMIAHPDGQNLMVDNDLLLEKAKAGQLKIEHCQLSITATPQVAEQYKQLRKANPSKCSLQDQLEILLQIFPKWNSVPANPPSVELCIAPQHPLAEILNDHTLTIRLLSELHSKLELQYHPWRQAYEFKLVLLVLSCVSFDELEAALEDFHHFNSDELPGVEFKGPPFLIDMAEVVSSVISDDAPPQVPTASIEIMERCLQDKELRETVSKLNFTEKFFLWSKLTGCLGDSPIKNDAGWLEDMKKTRLIAIGLPAIGEVHRGAIEVVPTKLSEALLDDLSYVTSKGESRKVFDEFVNLFSSVKG